MKKTMGLGDKAFQTVNYLVFTLFALTCMYPFYYIIINTVSANNLVDLGKVMFYPASFHFNNYIEVLKLERIARAALISVSRTLLGTALSVLGSAYMGYLFTKNNMWLHKFWYRFVIITMYFSAGLIPVYMNMKMLGLMNSFWVYVIPGIFPVFNMVLVKTFMESISPSMEESAQIDGAGYFRCFFSIMLPLSIPILATVALFGAVGQWNSWMDTLLYISDYKLFSLQFLLREYFTQAEKVLLMQESGINATSNDIEKMITPTAIRLTITVVVTVPIMCVYPFIQRYYIKGVMVGAIKG